jgi:hypothetical protein
MRLTRLVITVESVLDGLFDIPAILRISTRTRTSLSSVGNSLSRYTQRVYDGKWVLCFTDGTPHLTILDRRVKDHESVFRSGRSIDRVHDVRVAFISQDGHVPGDRVMLAQGLTG